LSIVLGALLRGRRLLSFQSDVVLPSKDETMHQRKGSKSKPLIRSIFKPAAKSVGGNHFRLQLEALEQRALLSVAPAGSEFRVNTFTTALQGYPAVAADAAGDYVVAWQSNGQTNSYNIYAQRLRAAL
jgi:hypothetical protein